MSTPIPDTLAAVLAAELNRGPEDPWTAVQAAYESAEGKAYAAALASGGLSAEDAADLAVARLAARAGHHVPPPPDPWVQLSESASLAASRGKSRDVVSVQHGNDWLNERIVASIRADFPPGDK